MKKERIFWGLYFIAAAFLLLAGNLGVFKEISVWTIIISVFFAATMLKSLFHRNIPGVLFSLAFLAIVHARLLGIEAITPWPVLGAALLGSIGVSIIYHPKYFVHRHWEENETIETITENDMEFSTSFGSSIKYVNSDDFKRARLNCSFGGLKVYFDNALIQNDQAVIEIQASFSGVELYLPKGWNVVNHLETSFADLEEKNMNNTTGSPVVTLVGSISFSGVTIVYI